MQARAFITGLAGTAITPGERAFLTEAQPWGLILFKRNIDTAEQVAALAGNFREVVGRADAPVLIDQEGGRVQRMGPPHWPSYPPGAAYGRLYDRDPAKGVAAARLGARLIADDLAKVGITVDCLPVADVPAKGADVVIGDRAYGETPEKVSALAGAAAAGLADGGVLPVLKHIPGHGRATADSHAALPVVNATRAELEASDFAAFRPLAGLPLAMTAHVVFTAIDPVSPATTSAKMIQNVIRGGIGFQGLLMSDDISMGALSGSLRERTRAALAAGCDVALHCNGKLDEMREVAAESPLLAGEAARRAKAALAARHAPDEIDVAAARAQFAALMAEGAVTS
ncbi:MAG TPA: beta-N-acetylhexosaminidase [Xanthobacteraceae bacterium]|nr:beta-N-acetylhexosaminidase [Xanthobacteraceae bacterium]